ncbi:MAG: DNA polymerase III subunit delta' [Thermodesulfobacteriota bacterium]
MGFAEIIGHERPIRVLRTMITAGRLPHALLLAGPAGVGKKTMALALAAAVNCLAPVEGDACGACPACGKVRRGVHPDVEVFELEGKARIITIANVRELRTKIAFRPYEGRMKVFLMPGAERMQEEAANALLKTLEEPPPQSLLILTTTEEAGLLPTIVSRCLKVTLAPLPLRLVEDWLARVRGISGPRARLLASMSGGCLGRAADLGPDQVFSQRDRLVRELARLGPRDLEGGLAWAAELAGDEEVRPLVLSLLRFWFRDLMILAGAKGRPVVNEDLRPRLEQTAAGRRAEDFIAALREIDRAEDALNRFIRPELVLENLVLALADMGKVGSG